MTTRAFTAVTLAVLLLAACSKPDNSGSPASAASAVPAAAPMAALPDAGKIQSVPVSSQGTGHSAGEAVNDAIKLAILQVNGVSVDTSSEQFKFALDVATPYDDVGIRAAGFAEAVAQRSRGAVTEFKLVSLAGPDKSGLYKASIDAAVAKYVPPADSKKLKVVVAPIRIDGSELEFGDTRVQSQRIAQDIRQQVIDALTQTGRFSVLDRDTTDVQDELDMVASGQAPAAEIAKLGQAVSADVIWVGHINAFAYRKHARKLVTSDRELVSYDGGWSISQRIVNVATRQVMEADTLSGQAASIKATTLGSRFDPAQTAQSMEADLVREVVSATLMRTFPVSVVSHEGNNVVLSQGGQSVKEAAHYQLVMMGKEVKDPQTGESLGRVESPCCDVVIDRVTPKLSYGHLENIQVSIDQAAPGALQLRGMSKSVPKPDADVTGTAPENNPAASLPSSSSHPATQHVASKHVKAHPGDAAEGGGEDKNW